VERAIACLADVPPWLVRCLAVSANDEWDATGDFITIGLVGLRLSWVIELA
jgi:hypothetical protein